MKYLDFFEHYKYKKIKSNEFVFYDEFSNKFKVIFDKLDNESSELKYYVFKDGKWCYDIVKTNIYQLFETIFNKILNKYINKNNWCNQVVIKGLQKEYEDKMISKRFKAYLRYLTKNPIIGWDIDTYQNEIYLYKKL